MKNYHPIFLILLLFLGSCSIEPQPINYGKDACHFCKMNIVDSQHAAQFVTEKGKCYKFDAIECMLNQMKDFDEAPIALHLITDYSNPGELTDATSATYLISNAIPSPMGAFLSGFSNQEKASSTQKQVGGKLLNWEEVKQKYGL
ncbi:MAG: nitrous oxide reductase accessory protein NosL [Flavobacteriales bacterium]|nr:nitrous oxide reductase accessory protein NosL [Flavobacteriales bacterium]